MILNMRELHVWYRFTMGLDTGLASESSVLSIVERERARKFVHEFDRRDYAAGHDLLRRVLSLYEDRAPEEWDFETTATGKPTISVRCGSRLRFNLSHARGLVACAVARDRETGIDVECVKGIVKESSIASQYFCEEEVAALNQCGPLLRAKLFIELWTLKEAYLKTIGVGLDYSLDACQFSIVGTRIRMHDFKTESRQVAFALFAPSNEWRLAVAVEGAPSLVIVRSFDDAPNQLTLSPIAQSSTAGL